MIVGHEPDLGDLMARLLRMPAQHLHVRKCSLTCITVNALREGAGRLEWSMPVKLMT